MVAAAAQGSTSDGLACGVGQFIFLTHPRSEEMRPHSFCGALEAAVSPASLS